MKKVAYLIAVVSCLLLALCLVACFGTDEPAPVAQPAAPAVEGQIPATLSLGRDVYFPGDTINLVYMAPVNLPTNAWIGIVPSDVPHGSEEVNDKSDISYQYLKGTTSGIMEFIAPSAPGSYDLRMNESDAGGKELASITFTVQ
ncbi:MAG: hypothetical protein JW765_10400 [Deltaproteobacteria bacterium]|nr:hypothetical protein [Candidatus Zymogenaceae bacterium]